LRSILKEAVSSLKAASASVDKFDSKADVGSPPQGSNQEIQAYVLPRARELKRRLRFAVSASRTVSLVSKPSSLTPQQVTEKVLGVPSDKAKIADSASVSLRSRIEIKCDVSNHSTSSRISDSSRGAQCDVSSSVESSSSADARPSWDLSERSTSSHFSSSSRGAQSDLSSAAASSSSNSESLSGDMSENSISSRLSSSSQCARSATSSAAASSSSNSDSESDASSAVESSSSESDLGAHERSECSTSSRISSSSHCPLCSGSSAIASSSSNSDAQSDAASAVASSSSNSELSSPYYDVSEHSTNSRTSSTSQCAHSSSSQCALSSSSNSAPSDTSSSIISSSSKRPGGDVCERVSMRAPNLSAARTPTSDLPRSKLPSITLAAAQRAASKCAYRTTPAARSRTLLDTSSSSRTSPAAYVDVQNEADAVSSSTSTDLPRPSLAAPSFVKCVRNMDIHTMRGIHLAEIEELESELQAALAMWPAQRSLRTSQDEPNPANSGESDTGHHPGASRAVTSRRGSDHANSSSSGERTARSVAPALSLSLAQRAAARRKHAIQVTASPSVNLASCMQARTLAETNPLSSRCSISSKGSVSSSRSRRSNISVSIPGKGKVGVRRANANRQTLPHANPTHSR